jgi:hypothetical protein
MIENNNPWVYPNWPAPNNVSAISTIRSGGVSKAPYNSFNLAHHVGDNELDVMTNRQLLEEKAHLPKSPVWLNQVHSDRIIEVTSEPLLSLNSVPPTADASYTQQSGIVLAIMTADCLPILLCNSRGRWIAAVHAGWRGLAAGIVTKTVQNYPGSPQDLLAWLGPAIGQGAFEVGENVLQAFVRSRKDAKAYFKPIGDKYLADLYALAKVELQALGVQVYGGNFCTYSEEERFFSYRRDGITGRMASLIWLNGEP